MTQLLQYAYYFAPASPWEAVTDFLEALALDALDVGVAGLAYLAALGWGSVFSGTAAFNGDAGIAVAFTFFTVMAFCLSRIPFDRWPFARHDPLPWPLGK